MNYFTVISTTFLIFLSIFFYLKEIQLLINYQEKKVENCDLEKI
jgi:hypothetical protein